MRLEGVARATESAAAVNRRVAEFMAARGYARVGECATQALFRRGSLIGSLTSFSPKKWAAHVSAQWLGTSEVRVAFKVNTTLQTVTDAERAFWAEEMAGLLAAIESQEPAPMPAIELSPGHVVPVLEATRLAAVGKRAVLFTVLYSLAGGLLVGFVQIVLHPLGIKLSPGFAGVGAGAGAAIGAAVGYQKGLAKELRRKGERNR